MSGISVSRSVNAPAARVFELMTDLEGAPERIVGIKSVEVLTEGQFGTGTRWRETRIMFGKEATEEMEVAEFVPGRSYVVTAYSCGTDYRSEISVTPEGEGCRIDFVFEGRPRRVMARLMSPMLFFMKGMLRRMLNQDLEDVAAAAEGRPRRDLRAKTAIPA